MNNITTLRPLNLLAIFTVLALSACGGGGGGGGGDPATHLALSALPVTVYGRVPIKITVTALDASNNIVMGYSGTVHVSSTDVSAALPSDFTLTGGIGTTQLSFVTAGAQSVTMADTAGVLMAATSTTVTVAAPPPLVINSGAPPVGTVTAAYSPYEAEVCLSTDMQGCQNSIPELVHIFPLAATGGVGSIHFSWSAQTGSTLPPGLEIDTASILTVGFDGFGIAGTPQQAGSYAVTLTATDGGSPPATASANYTIVIQSWPPPPPTFAAVPDPQGATLNQNYAYSFIAAPNTIPPVTFSESGALPPGLSLNSQGQVSGIPTSVGSFPIRVTATDSAGQPSAPKDFTLQVFQHGFIGGGMLRQDRKYHTATLLSTGLILVVGGTGDYGFLLSSAELYAPASQTSMLIQDMLVPLDIEVTRSRHTATLLCDLSASSCSNPLVLIAGGATSYWGQLFDPATNTSRPTYNMSSAHFGATATLLTSGRVLIAGGDQSSVAQSYDQVSEGFSSPVNMSVARVGHTATLLANGKVLITGGRDQLGNLLASAEIYDPVAGVFVSTANMTTRRTNHTATLLPSGRVLIAGGYADVGTLASAELYDPVSNVFTATSDLVTSRADHAAGLLPNGMVLIVGGQDNNSNPLSHAELFDSSTATFSNTGRLQVPRSLHTMTVLGGSGQVQVIGGAQGSSPINSAELYR